MEVREVTVEVNVVTIVVLDSNDNNNNGNSGGGDGDKSILLNTPQFLVLFIFNHIFVYLKHIEG